MMIFLSAKLLTTYLSECLNLTEGKWSHILVYKQLFNWFMTYCQPCKSLFMIRRQFNDLDWYKNFLDSGRWFSLIYFFLNNIQIKKIVLCYIWFRKKKKGGNKKKPVLGMIGKDYTKRANLANLSGTWHPFIFGWTPPNSKWRLVKKECESK